MPFVFFQGDLQSGFCTLLRLLADVFRPRYSISLKPAAFSGSLSVSRLPQVYNPGMINSPCMLSVLPDWHLHLARRLLLRGWYVGDEAGLPEACSAVSKRYRRNMCCARLRHRSTAAPSTTPIGRTPRSGPAALLSAAVEITCSQYLFPAGTGVCRLQHHLLAQKHSLHPDSGYKSYCIDLFGEHIPTWFADVRYLR